MKKLAVYAVCATLLLGSCDSYMGTGAYAGANLGSILGSAIGGIAGGPRGSDLGTIVGMAGGAVVGAAIGQATEERKAAEAGAYQQERARQNYERKMSERQQDDANGSYRELPSTDSGFDESNSGDDRIDDFTGKSGRSNVVTETVNPANLTEKTTYTPIVDICNARFLDGNEDGVIERDELCTVVFEVMNRSQQTLYDVQPAVIEATGNRHLTVSPGILVEQIEPGKGIRYTAVVKADNRLKAGSTKICVSVLQGSRVISKVSEFNIPTTSTSAH